MDDQLEKFDINSSDEELLETFEHWKKESVTYHDQILQKQKKSIRYYHGDQTMMGDVPDYLSNTVENRLFEATETLVPVATASAHQFQVAPGSENEEADKRAQNLQLVLARKYVTLEMQKKLEDVTRNIIVQRFGVMKWFWNLETDNIDVISLDPKLIMVPKLRMDPHDLPYVIEIQGYSHAELEEQFPDVDLDEIGGTDKTVDTGKEDNTDKKQIQVFEVWTPEMVAWITPGKVLEKMPNPYWDFEGTEVKVRVEGKKKRKEKKELKFFNHFDTPQKPYVFGGTFNISSGPLPETSLFEIGIPIADSINVQKRAIINNLKQMGNGQVYVDSDAMTEEEADNMTNEPGVVYRGAGLASEKKIRREPGTPIPSGHFSNLQHSETVFDNLMGVHSATRGQAQAKTLGQDILSRQQDFTRIDTLTRVLNRMVDRVANGLVQLMKLNYTENHLIKVIGEEGAVSFVNLNRTNIDDHIEIQVKSGQNLPMDEVSLRTEALQLWQFGAIDPVTLFERLKFPNPEKAAELLLLWLQGQLEQKTRANIAEAEAGAQARAEASPAANPQERGSEAPANVLQRARANLGGGAPSP